MEIDFIRQKVMERKRHDLATENLHSARDEWNKVRMKGIDFIDKKLRVFINYMDEAILEYYQIFV